MPRDGDVKEPKAKKGKDDRPDGELSPDELAERRAAKANGNGSASISQRARDGEDLDPDGQAEAFPIGSLVGDPKRTVKNLIKAGAKVTTSVSLTRAAVPNPSGGLFDPEEEVEILVRVLPGYAKQTPIHSEQAGKITVKEWSIAQELRVVHVQAAGAMYTEEQVVELLEAGGVPAAQITSLLGHDEATGTGG